MVKNYILKQDKRTWKIIGKFSGNKLKIIKNGWLVGKEIYKYFRELQKKKKKK